MGKSGCLGLVLLLAVGLPLTFAPLLVQVFLGDRDRSGAVPVPGSAEIELPAEKVTVFFRETGIFGENEGANEPDDFEFDVTPARGGESLELDGAGFFGLSATAGDDAYDPIGTIEPPAEGTYVVTSTADVDDAQSPALSFGTGSSGRLPRLSVVGLIVDGLGLLLLMAGVVRADRKS